MAQAQLGDFPGHTAFWSKVNSRKNYAPLKKEEGEMVEHFIARSSFKRV